LFLNAHEAMERAGINTEEIYRRLPSFDPRRMLRPGARHPHEWQALFWNMVEEVTGDSEIGLHLCPHLSPFAGEVVNHLIVSSATVGDALHRLVRYVRLLSDHLKLKVLADPSQALAAMIFEFGDARTPRHSEITVLYGTINMFRFGSGRRFAPTSIELRCSPGSDAAEFARTFDCPVMFGAAQTRCWFSRDMLELSLPHHDPEAVRAHESLAQRKLRKVLKQDTIAEVRRVVASRLDDPPCTLQVVARELGRTPRSLRKELLDADTSFSQVVTDVRQMVSKRLLTSSMEPIERIAVLVGFSERSAFFRAFKGWTGVTPTQYRKAISTATPRSSGPPPRRGLMLKPGAGRQL